MPNDKPVTTDDYIDDVTKVRICFALLCEDPAVDSENKAYYETVSDAFERLVEDKKL